MYTTETPKDRRMSSRTELNRLVTFATVLLAEKRMAWAAQVNGRTELVIARVSPSRIYREARRLLLVYPEQVARERLASWVADLVDAEHQSYARTYPGADAARFDHKVADVR